MSKVILVVFALIVCSFATTPFEQIKQIVQKDECSTHAMETLRPKIQNKIQELKTNPNDLKAKTELLAMIDDAKSIYDGCRVQEKVETQLGDVVQAAGVGFLLASNCFKDVGVVLLLGDEIIQDPKDVVGDIFILIFLYILGRQGYADCEQFINFVF